MLFSLTHEIGFTFEDPVYFEPIFLRMRPRTDATQALLSFRLESSPSPERIDRISDLDGNDLDRLWFRGSQKTLVLRTMSRVRTFRSNPFDFLFHDSRAGTLPLSYPPRFLSLLSPYLAPEKSTGRGPLFGKFLTHLKEASRMETLPFLIALARHIPEVLTAQIREEGPPRSPEETLEEGSGSCRDFALLAMEACRSLNIAARFTSGYHLPTVPPSPSLHGWAEVYLPEVGWRGLDPSEGILTADRHIALVSSADPVQTLPTEGSYRGEGSSTLTTSVRVDLLEEGPAGTFRDFADPPDQDIG
ncbi:MAG: transglutaminase family protein [Nitrospiraceae bacterium]|nr:transglutaminase family protein [Nitrospiraceae bacterium]